MSLSSPSAASARHPSVPSGLAVLFALALVCGLLANTVGPSRIPWFTAWSQRVADAAAEYGIPVVATEEARRLVDEGMHFIFDARAPAEFARGHLPGAMNFYSGEFDEFFQMYALMLIPEQPVLVYCSGQACDESLLVGRNLLELGFTNVVLYAEGVEGWKAAGYPMEGGF
jgi:rhodanese-related sulfurtransferase